MTKYICKLCGVRFTTCMLIPVFVALIVLSFYYFFMRTKDNDVSFYNDTNESVYILRSYINKNMVTDSNIAIDGNKEGLSKRVFLFKTKNSLVESISFDIKVSGTIEKVGCITKDDDRKVSCSYTVHYSGNGHAFCVCDPDYYCFLSNP